MDPVDSLTGQSLYYMDSKPLKHVDLIDEDHGNLTAFSDKAPGLSPVDVFFS